MKRTTLKEIEFQAEEQIVGGTLSLVGNGGLAETTPVWNSLTLIVNPQIADLLVGL